MKFDKFEKLNNNLLTLEEATILTEEIYSEKNPGRVVDGNVIRKYFEMVDEN